MWGPFKNGCVIPEFSVRMRVCVLYICFHGWNVWWTEKNTVNRHEQKKKKIKCYFIRRRTCSPWWQATVSTTMQTLPPSPPRSISRTDFSLYQNHNIQPLVQGEHATVILFLNLRAPKKTFLFFPMIRCNPVWFCKWTDVYFYISVICLQKSFPSSYLFKIIIFLIKV